MPPGPAWPSYSVSAVDGTNSAPWSSDGARSGEPAQDVDVEGGAVLVARRELALRVDRHQRQPATLRVGVRCATPHESLGHTLRLPTDEQAGRDLADLGGD